MKKLFFFIILFFAVESITNSRPIINSTSFKVKENQTSIGQIDATDEDNDVLTYYVYPADEVSIDENTGVLSFNASPDFETKKRYTFRAYAYDGKKTTSKKIIVQIKNVNEHPFLTKDKYKAYQGRNTVMRLKATDPEGETLAFSIAGDDAEYFQVSKRGAVTFKSEPDVSEKTIFDLQAVISDGKKTAYEDFKIELITKFLYLYSEIDDFTKMDQFPGHNGILSMNENDNRLAIGPRENDLYENIYIYHKRNDEWNVKETITIDDNLLYQNINLSNSGNTLSFSSFTSNFSCDCVGASCTIDGYPEVAYTVWSFNEIIKRWVQRKSFKSKALHIDYGDASSISEDGDYIAYLHMNESDYEFSGCYSKSSGRVLVKDIETGTKIGNTINLSDKNFGEYFKVILIDEKTLLLSTYESDKDGDGCADSYVSLYKLNFRNKWKMKSQLSVSHQSDKCFLTHDLIVNDSRNKLLHVTGTFDDPFTTQIRDFTFYNLTNKGIIVDRQNKSFQITNGTRRVTSVGNFYSINPAWNKIAYTAYAIQFPSAYKRKPYITVYKKENKRWKQYANYQCFREGIEEDCGHHHSLGNNEIAYSIRRANDSGWVGIPVIKILKINE